MKIQKYLVIGSGICSYSFLSTLKKKQLYNCRVITGKNSNKIDHKYNSKHLDIDTRYKFGGLGKDWLGGFSYFKKKEIKFPNMLLIDSIFKIQKEISENYKINLNKENIRIPSFLKNLFKQKNFFKFERSKVLRDFFLNKNSILRPKKIKGAKYTDGIVTNIYKKNKYYEVIVKEGNKSKIILSEFIFFASGTIETTKLLMKMKILPKKTKISHHPYFYGVFVTKNNSNNQFQNFDLPILSYSYEKNNISITGSIGLYSKRIESIIKKLSYGLINLNFIKKIVYNKLIFFNGFINSNHGRFQIKNSKNGFEIKSLHNNKKINTIRKIFISDFKETLKKNNVRVLFSRVNKTKLGSDKHYFGSIRNKNIVNKNSEIRGFKNNFILDQSVININTSKFVTILSIFNAIKIAKIINNLNK